MKEIILNFERELRFTLHGEPRTGFLRIEKPLLVGMARVGIARRGETSGRS